MPKKYVRGRGGGWEGSEDPETWLGVWRGGLSPPAVLNPSLCGSPGGSIADFIYSGRIDFVLESPPHP